jgi:4-amino-4-deoxy-L-arabinose transferase-like glycosyltransferase
MLMTVGLVSGLSGYPLLDPDEGRNAEVAREMAATNNYVLPHLNGLPYVDKPVIFFAVTAASIELFGVTEFAVRLAPLLFTGLTLVVVWCFSNRLYGRSGAWIATIATGTMPLTLGFARTVIFDSALTFFVTGAIATFFLAMEDDTGHRQSWTALAFACIALGILTKGPIALALPLLVAVPYGIWRRRWRVLVDPVGWLLVVALVLPWVAAVSRDVPDFVPYVLFTETVGRLFTDELRRTGPFWYFIPIVLAGSLPWSLVAISGWRAAQRDAGQRPLSDRRLVLALLWIVVPLVFFSLSQSKRPQYMVPLMAPVGLVVCHLWTTATERPRGVRAASIPLMIVAGIMGAASLVVPNLIEVTPGVAEAIGFTSLVLAGTTFVAAFSVWLLPPRTTVVLALFSLPAAAIPISSLGLMKAIGDDRSAHGAAVAITPNLQPTTEIVAIDTYPLSLPFYLDRTLTLATTDGSELTSNYLVRYLDRFRTRMDTSLRPADWWLEALTNCSRPRIFVTGSNNSDVRDILASRLRMIIDDRDIAVYGPCDVEVLAQGKEK